MAKNAKERKAIDEIFNDLTALFRKTLQPTQDREAVLLGATILDELLGRIIEAFMIDNCKPVRELLGLEGGDRPLSTFASRIKAAFCLA